jgi:hypothetical protein
VIFLKVLGFYLVLLEQGQIIGRYNNTWPWYGADMKSRQAERGLPEPYFPI